MSADGTIWRIACVILTVAALAALVVSLTRPESFVVTTSVSMVVLMLIVLTSLGEEQRDAIWWLLVLGASMAVLANLVGLAVTRRRKAEASADARAANNE